MKGGVYRMLTFYQCFHHIAFLGSTIQHSTVNHPAGIKASAMPAKTNP